MLRNFLKVAFRSLWRQRGYSFLNIFGLAMGMGCSLLILLWVRDERSVDNFHDKLDRLYAVYERQYYDGKVDGLYNTPGLLAQEMKKKLPEVEMASTVSWQSENTYQAGDKILKEKGRYAGEDIFRMFSYPLLEGSAKAALSDPTGIALSRKMATDFFGSVHAAMGKTLLFDNSKSYKVTAVFEDVPKNASMQFDWLISWQSFLAENSWVGEWGNNAPSTFLLLRKDADPAAFSRKINRFLYNYNAFDGKGFYIQLDVQHYGDMYLHNHFKEGRIEGGRAEYVRLFSLVAIFILLIACINFMNLTTARSVKRSKEIGVRKVVGALRPALIRQFMGEAILLAVLSVILAISITILVLPAFNLLTHKSISFPYGSASFWLSLGGLTLLTGLVSGSYPALFLSSFKPVLVLKGAMKTGMGAVLFRKGLVVFQFILSIVLILSTLVVSRQMNYIQAFNLGYDRDNLLYIPVQGELLQKYALFKERALQLPGIADVSRVSQDMTDLNNGTYGVDWDGKEPNSKPMFTSASAGYDMTRTMKLQLVAGRDYSRDYPTDSLGYILNEQALAKIGYKDPIGKPLTFWGKKGKIIGVLRDFHFNSLHESVKPLIIRFGEKDDYGNIMVRIKAGQTPVVLEGLKRLSREMNPKFPFTSYFADLEYQNMYRAEVTVHRLSNCFAGLAIFISCLGLLGLAMYTAEQRTKEFGIRKVLGAKAATLFALLSRDFLVLVIIAFLPAAALAWWAMQSWLRNFAYHVQLEWWLFLVAGALALLIALFTVSFQAARSAMANPVKALRSE
jgi:putative ABC transport system permease protein